MDTFQVCSWPVTCDPVISPVSHRCDLLITASSTLDIQIQVELEVLDVVYNLPTNPNVSPIMILSVMINRPCAWIPLTGENRSFISVTSLTFLIRKNLVWENWC